MKCGVVERAAASTWSQEPSGLVLLVSPGPYLSSRNSSLCCSSYSSTDSGPRSRPTLRGSVANHSAGGLNLMFNFFARRLSSRHWMQCSVLSPPSVSSTRWYVSPCVGQVMSCHEILRIPIRLNLFASSPRLGMSDLGWGFGNQVFKFYQMKV